MALVAADRSVVYRCGVDFEAVDAIDVHTHVELDSRGHHAYDDVLVEATRVYFKMDEGVGSNAVTVDDLAAHYRRNNVAAVVFTVDAETAMGHLPNSVEDLITGAARNNDVLIPFGTVDPWKRRAVSRVRELVHGYGVRGFKFHPSMQAFEPNDRRFYPIYEAIAAAGVPALFHTGQTGIGSGLPGGHRIKLRYSDPMLLDDVAADFPDLTIVMAHPAVPWVDAQIAIATHKSQRLHRPVRLFTEVLSAATGAGDGPAAAHQSVVRHRPSVHRYRSLAPRFRRLWALSPEIADRVYKQNALRVLGERKDA